MEAVRTPMQLSRADQNREHVQLLQSFTKRSGLSATKIAELFQVSALTLKAWYEFGLRIPDQAAEDLRGYCNDLAEQPGQVDELLVGWMDARQPVKPRR